MQKGSQGGFMFIHMTIIHIDVENTGEVRRIITDPVGSWQSLAPLGLRQSALIESMDDSGEIIWLSFWETRAQAVDFMTSPEYAVLVGKLNPYLLSGPEWHSYRLVDQAVGVEK